MIDSILSGVLAIGVLVGGTAAFGLETVRAGQHSAVAAVTVTLPTVTVVGHRQPAEVLVASR